MTAQNAWPGTPRQQVAWLLERRTHAADIGLAPTALSADLYAGADESERCDRCALYRQVQDGDVSCLRSADGAQYKRADQDDPRVCGDRRWGQHLRAGAARFACAAHAGAPPTIPTDIRTTGQNDGSIRITWKAKNVAPGAGTAFTIHRRLNGQASYEVVGTSGVRSFVDETVPAGAPSVSYMIRGIRGEKVGGFSEPVTVYLGKVGINGEGQGLSLAA